MMRPLLVMPLAMFLAAAFPVLSLAEDTVEECRKMAIEEEVAPEDMEDYIAECLAVIQSESSEDAAEALDQPAQGNQPGPTPGAANAAGKKP